VVALLGPLTVIAVVAGCGSVGDRSESGSASTTSAGPATTTTTSAVDPELARPGVHELPEPPLPGPLLDVITFTQVGDQVLAWGPKAVAESTGRYEFDPTDVGALLDPHTLRWTKLPVPAFAHPTTNAQLAWVAGRIVLVGNSCTVDPSRESGDDTGAPDCPLGPVQAATFDPGSSHWQVVTVPPTVTGFVQYGLVVGDDVLVVTVDQNQPGDQFNLLDPTTGTWTAVAPPQTGQPEVICSSKGTAFAVNIRVKTASGSWTEAETANGSNGDERYGQVQVSSLSAGTTAWSAPGPPALAAGAQLASSGCVGGGVLLVAEVSADRSASPGQTGAWLYQPGGTWTPVASPPASSMSINVVGQLATTPLDHDQVSLDSTSPGSRVFDGSTHQWSVLAPVAPGASGVRAHIGTSQLAVRSTDQQLLAVTP
jgi:hypothetical protein